MLFYFIFWIFSAEFLWIPSHFLWISFKFTRSIDTKSRLSWHFSGWTMLTHKQLFMYITYLLLKRLNESFRTTGALIAWFISYITNRAQTVVFKQSRSQTVTLSFGVHQGSVLGRVGRFKSWFKANDFLSKKINLILISVSYATMFSLSSILFDWIFRILFYNCNSKYTHVT